MSSQLIEKTRKVAEALILWEVGRTKMALAVVIKYRLHRTPFLKAHEFPGLEKVDGTHQVWNEFYGEFKLVQSTSRLTHVPELNLQSLKQLSQMYSEI